MAGLIISDQLSASSICSLTNKMIYSEFASFPVPIILGEAAVDYQTCQSIAFHAIRSEWANFIAFIANSHVLQRKS